MFILIVEWSSAEIFDWLVQSGFYRYMYLVRFWEL